VKGGIVNRCIALRVDIDESLASGQALYFDTLYIVSWTVSKRLSVRVRESEDFTESQILLLRVF